MSTIAQLFENALLDRSEIHRKAAKRTIAKMPGDTKLKELLGSDGKEAIRSLTIQDLREALGGSEVPRPRLEIAVRPEVTQPAPLIRAVRRRHVITVQEPVEESRKARIFKLIRAHCTTPQTIQQLQKRTGADPDELRGYLDWMRREQIVGITGNGRGRRYHLLEKPLEFFRV